MEEFTGILERWTPASPQAAGEAPRPGPLLREFGEILQGLPPQWRDEHCLAAARREIEAWSALCGRLGALARAWDAQDRAGAAAACRELAGEGLECLPRPLAEFLRERIIPHPERAHEEDTPAPAPAGGEAPAGAAEQLEALLERGEFRAAAGFLEQRLREGEVPWAVDALLEVARRAAEAGRYDEEGHARSLWWSYFDRWPEAADRIPRLLEAVIGHCGARSGDGLAACCRYGDLLLREYGGRGRAYLELVRELYLAIRERPEGRLTPLAQRLLELEPDELAPYLTHVRSLPPGEEQELRQELWIEALVQPVWVDLGPDTPAQLEFAFPLAGDWSLEETVARFNDAAPEGMDASRYRFRPAHSGKCSEHLLCRPVPGHWDSIEENAVAFEFVRGGGLCHVYYRPLLHVAPESATRLTALRRAPDPAGTFLALGTFQEKARSVVAGIMGNWQNQERRHRFFRKEGTLVRKSRFHQPPDRGTDGDGEIR